jgi:hypothetical protein
VSKRVREAAAAAAAAAAHSRAPLPQKKLHSIL